MSDSRIPDSPDSVPCCICECGKPCYNDCATCSWDEICKMCTEKIRRDFVKKSRIKQTAAELRAETDIILKG